MVVYQLKPVTTMLYNNLGQDKLSPQMSRADRLATIASYIRPIYQPTRRETVDIAQDYDVYYNESDMAESWDFNAAPANLDTNMPDYM